MTDQLIRSRNDKQKSRDLLGDDEYKRQESAKRKARRDAAKLLKTKPKNPIFEEIYQAKAKIASDQGKTILRSSVDQQVKKIINLKKKMQDDGEEFDFLKDTKKVIKFIEKSKNWKTPNSVSSIIQAIASITKALPDFDKTYTIYSKYSVKLRNATTKQDDENLSSEKEKESAVPWETLKSLHKTKNLSLRNKAIVAFYTLLPPRRLDPGYLKIVYGDEYPDDEKYNYLVINGDKSTLIYDNYKTSKYYGTQSIAVPAALLKILKAYIKDEGLKEGDALFGKPDGSVYAKFFPVLSQAFKAAYPEKPITVNILRHSKITDFLTKKTRSTAEKKKMATLMGHSPDLQQKYLRLDQANE